MGCAGSLRDDSLVERPAEESELIAALSALTSQLRGPQGLGSVAAVSEAVGASESSVRTWFGWRSSRLSAPGPRHRSAARDVLEKHLGRTAAMQAERLWVRWESIAADRAYQARTAPKGARPDRDDPARRRRATLGRQFLRGGWNPQATAISLDGTALRLGSDVTDGELPPYVGRGVDARLDQRIGDALAAESSTADRIVGVAGPPKSGKTRSLVEALCRHEDVGRTRLLLLQPPPAVGGADWVASFVDAVLNSDVLDYGGPAAAVVFVDDLHLYCTGGEVWPELLRLVRDAPNAVVVFTIHEEYLHPPSEVMPGDPRHSLDLDGVAAAVEVLNSELNPIELELARSLLPTVEVAELSRLAERLANTPILLAKARLARSAADQVANASLLYGLLDLCLLQPAGSDRARIRLQQSKWWSALAPTSGPLTDQHHSASFDWAVAGVGRVWALCMSTEPGRDQWRLHDGVAATLRHEHAPLPSIKYDEDVTVLELLRLALNYQEWAYNVYHPLLVAAMNRSASISSRPLTEVVGPDDGSQNERFHRAVDQGHIEAVNALGDLLVSEGDGAGAAQYWWMAAMLANSAHAWVQLGTFYAHRDDRKSAYRAFREAAGQGDPHAQFALGTLFYEDGATSAARRFWELAHESGHAPALRCLGMLKAEAGDPSGRELLRQARELGDSTASEMLAALARMDAEVSPFTAEEAFLRIRGSEQA